MCDKFSAACGPEVEFPVLFLALTLLGGKPVQLRYGGGVGFQFEQQTPSMYYAPGVPLPPPDVTIPPTAKVDAQMVWFNVIGPAEMICLFTEDDLIREVKRAREILALHARVLPKEEPRKADH